MQGEGGTAKQRRDVQTQADVHAQRSDVMVAKEEKRKRGKEERRRKAELELLMLDEGLLQDATKLGQALALCAAFQGHSTTVPAKTFA